MVMVTMLIAVAVGLFGADYLLMAQKRAQRWDLRPGLEGRSTRRRLERILRKYQP